MRILIVDDEGGQARQVANALREVLPDAEFVVCHDEASAEAAIAAQSFDAAILDLLLQEEPTLEQQKDLAPPDLGAFEGIRLATALAKKHPRCKAVIVSASKIIAKGLLVNLPKTLSNIVDVIDKNLKSIHGGYSYRDYLRFRIATIQRDLSESGR
ncbi:hypothetical protein [Azospirillum lipoferum]|uniref:hypothetical protein n=1 Tax=Azospirillum lipoferum TaxID=193 RepID=UPI001395D785|nr:hypothetical protein [Azospirillum lipoferum]